MKKKAKVFLRKEQNFKTVTITGLDKPQIAQMVIEKWQKIIELLAKILDLPSGFINLIEVFTRTWMEHKSIIV